MKKNKDKIVEIINKLSGTILGIGIVEDNYLDAINENDDITLCHLMNLKNLQSKNSKALFKTKTINIKKIRKKFKKKKINYIICKIDDIKDYLRTFIKDSIFIAKEKIYFYGNKEIIDYEKLISKYNRYNTKISTFQDKDYIIIEIDVTKAKNEFIKDIGYSFVDTAEYIADLIANALMS